MAFEKKEKVFDSRCEFRCTKEEKLEIREQAEAAGLGDSEYLRRRALGKKVMSKSDAVLINELRRLGGLQKHLFTQDQGKSREYSQVLIALQKAIEKIARMENDSEDGNAPK
jgi:hypothetical protein